MKRIGTIICLAAAVVIAKFGGLISMPWEHLRIVSELAMVWLIYDLVRNPVTQFITLEQSPPNPYFRKMAAVQAARVSKRPLRFHLKSGETREGFVVAHSLSSGSFVIVDSIEHKADSEHRHYDACDVDELIVTPRVDQESVIHEVAEATT